MSAAAGKPFDERIALPAFDEIGAMPNWVR